MPHTRKSRLHLSWVLVGLLCAYSAPKALAQDAPPGATNDQAPAAQAPNNQDPNAPPPPAEQQQAPVDQNQNQNQAPPAAPPPSNAQPPLSNAPNAPTSAGTAEQPDPPNRAARISFLSGSVSLQPGGEGDWGNAVLNRPVTVGDKIWVDKDSRAELEAGQITFHLGNMTALSFLNLDGPVTQVRLPEGSVNFRVREMREGDVYEIDTPNLAFTVKQAGAYRIDVAENGDGTRITAIRGEGEVTANGQTYTVHPGERAEFVGTDTLTYTAHGAPPPDGLDRWANDRDLREDNSTSARYVNPDVPGVSDLDDNGTWSEQPDVGEVWTPNNVPPDWAPYSDGAWNYVAPWGWSWVGYEPWGYAPYHYGRWGFYGGRWGWSPGPIWAPPFYGPAFVGFLGGGFGFGVGLGFGFGFGGGIGWFPLGFGEPFHPWYHAGFGYIHNVNIHNTVIRNASVINSRNFNYAYAHNAHAVTATSRNGFTNGERVNRGAANINAASLRNARVTNGAGVSPTRSSFAGAASRTGNVARPSSSVQTRSVVARTTPAARAAGESVRSSSSFAGNRTNGSANSRASVNSRATGNSTRSWSAQGNVTDHGTAPRGAGHNNSVQTAHNVQSDRPQWARGNATNSAARSSSTINNRASINNSNRAPNTNANRSYQPQRSAASSANRSYTPQSRSYSAPTRSYSAPSRSYSAPSHSAPAASHSSGGGGSRGGGGSHGGGGGSHGGGGHH